MKCGECRFFSRRGWCRLRNMKTYADIIACSFGESIVEETHKIQGMQGVKIIETEEGPRVIECENRICEKDVGFFDFWLKGERNECQYADICDVKKKAETEEIESEESEEE